jgi:hypothetical protein
MPRNFHKTFRFRAWYPPRVAGSLTEGADAPPRKPDAALLKAIARAHRWFEELVSGRTISLAAIASREGVTDRYVARLIRLAFLAPKIVEAIAERGELADLKLTPHVDLPLDWMTQRRMVGLE